MYERYTLEEIYALPIGGFFLWPRDTLNKPFKRWTHVFLKTNKDEWYYISLLGEMHFLSFGTCLKIDNQYYYYVRLHREPLEEYKKGFYKYDDSYNVDLSIPRALATVCGVEIEFNNFLNPYSEGTLLSTRQSFKLGKNKLIIGNESLELYSDKLKTNYLLEFYEGFKK